jgi:acetyltransferase-like isoleucine patch superfamily enzyme
MALEESAEERRPVDPANPRTDTAVTRSVLRSVLVMAFKRARYAWRRLRYAISYAGQPISIDPSSSVSRRSVIRVTDGGSIRIGRNCTVHDFAMILTYGGDVLIGDDCSLNPFAIVYGAGGVRIGNGVRIAAHTVIIPANHRSGSDDVPLHMAGIVAQGITIADHVWLGSGCRILDGVRIGTNAVVGAGSVVTRSVADNVTVVGVPARPIRREG